MAGRCPGVFSDRRHIRVTFLTDKNEPSRFLGEGMTFKAKLIGILEVNEARGDKMCQDALNDLKTAIRAAGEHKQRITISIAIDGLRLRDEKSGVGMREKWLFSFGAANSVYLLKRYTFRTAYTIIRFIRYPS